jgi:hypothetical protein
MKIAIVTTFNENGFETYGERMVKSFNERLPAEVDILVFTEGFTLETDKPRVKIYDLPSESPELVNLKARWKDVPKANGYQTNDTSGKPDFKYDAVRFSHKVFAIMAANKLTDADILIWVDGDTFAFENIPFDFILTQCPGVNEIASYLGRPDHYTECGWVAYNRRTSQEFLAAFAKAYLTDEIFTMTEWHDSWVFDRLRERFETSGNKFKNLTPNATRGQHVFINGDLGKYMDHMKGPRKQLGKSKPSDLKVTRTESYWNS